MSALGQTRMEVASVVLAALALGACTEPPPPGPAPEPPPLTSAPAELVYAVSCDEVRDRMAQAMVDNLLPGYDQWLRYGSSTTIDTGYMALQRSPWFHQTHPEPPGGSPAMASRVGPGVYATGHQAAADLYTPTWMATDGGHVYATVAGDQKLVVARAWPPETLEVLASEPLDGGDFYAGVALHGATLVVITTVELDRGGAEAAGADLVGLQGQKGTRLTFFDVSNPAAPRRVRQVVLEAPEAGLFAWQVGQHLLFTQRHAFPDALARQIQDELWRLNPVTDGRRVEDQAERQAVLAQVRQALLPQARALVGQLDDAALTPQGQQLDVDSGQLERLTLHGCNDVLLSSRPGGLGLTTLGVVDMARPDLPLRGTSLLGYGASLYLDRQRVLVAASNGCTRYAYDCHGVEGEPATTLHLFGLSQGQLIPQGSAHLPGAATWMDVEGDRVRVMSESGNIYAPDHPGNHYFELEVSGQALVDRGGLRSLGEPGEGFERVVMTQERGFVVMQPTPLSGPYDRPNDLRVLDLTQPGAPRIAGALTLQGKALRIWALDQTSALVLGRQTGFAGITLEVVDAADPDQPRSVHQARLPYDLPELDRDASVLHDGHLILPANQRGEGGDVGFLVLRLDARGGISEVGLAGFDGFAPLFCEGLDRFCEPGSGGPWRAQIRRAFVAADALIAVSNAGIQTSPLASPGQILDRLVLMEADNPFLD